MQTRYLPPPPLQVNDNRCENRQSHKKRVSVIIHLGSSSKQTQASKRQGSCQQPRFPSSHMQPTRERSRSRSRRQSSLQPVGAARWGAPRIQPQQRPRQRSRSTARARRLWARDLWNPPQASVGDVGWTSSHFKFWCIHFISGFHFFVVCLFPLSAYVYMYLGVLLCIYIYIYIHVYINIYIYIYIYIKISSSET